MVTKKARRSFPGLFFWLRFLLSYCPPPYFIETTSLIIFSPFYNFGQCSIKFYVIMSNADQTSITPEAIVNQVLAVDIPTFRNDLRAMMDGFFLYSCRGGDDPTGAYCAYMAVDGLLSSILEYNQQGNK